MSIKKFYATRSREAINMIKTEFGSDAEIISNKIVNGWVEVTARKGQAQTPEYSSFPETLSAAPLTMPTQSPEPTQPFDPLALEIMNEIKKMRQSVELKLNDLTWSNRRNIDHVQQDLLNALLMASFSPALSKRLVEKLPKAYTYLEAIEWARNILGKNLIIAQDESYFLDAGGAIALIGPTGVGKTTTLAKIAARYVLKYGAEKLALITTDSYRVGAIEQIRVYGKILGVPVHAAHDLTDLRNALEEFKHKHTVLIDTPGLNQRDPRVTTQLSLLTDVDFSVKKILCLNATSHIEITNDVVKAYQTASLQGCIITKTDEAMTLGNTLNVVMQHKLKVHYITTGQRVPEDIKLVDKATLFQQVLPEACRQASLIELDNGLFPIVFSANIPADKKRTVHHV